MAKRSRPGGNGGLDETVFHREIADLKGSINALTAAVSTLTVNTALNTQAIKESKDTSLSGDTALKGEISALGMRITAVEVDVLTLKISSAQAKGMFSGTRVATTVFATVALPCIGYVLLLVAKVILASHVTG